MGKKRAFWLTYINYTWCLLNTLKQLWGCFLCRTLTLSLYIMVPYNWGHVFQKCLLTYIHQILWSWPQESQGFLIILNGFWKSLIYKATFSPLALKYVRWGHCLQINQGLIHSIHLGVRLIFQTWLPVLSYLGNGRGMGED